MTVSISVSDYTNVKPAPKKRDDALDLIKGIMIVLMVYGHTSHVGQYASIQSYIVEWVYSFHMSVFYIISGYYYWSRFDLIDFHKDIFRRLIVPYILFEFFYLFGLSVVGNFGVVTSGSAPASATDFVATLLFFPKGAYWFIFTIIVGQLSFSVPMALLRQYDIDRTIILVIGLVIIGVCCLLGVLRPSAISYFLIGMALSAGRFGFPASFTVGLAGAAVCVAATQLKVPEFSIVQIAWCLSLISALVAVSRRFDNAILLIFSWIGRNSLIIALMHALFVVSLKTLSSLFLKFEPGGVFYSLFVTFMAVVLSILSAYIFDKTQLSAHIFGKDRIYAKASR